MNMGIFENDCMEIIPCMINGLWCNFLKGTMEVYKVLLMHFWDAPLSWNRWWWCTMQCFLSIKTLIVAWHDRMLSFGQKNSENDSGGAWTLGHSHYCEALFYWYVAQTIQGEMAQHRKLLQHGIVCSSSHHVSFISRSKQPIWSQSFLIGQ